MLDELIKDKIDTFLVYKTKLDSSFPALTLSPENLGTRLLLKDNLL